MSKTSKFNKEFSIDLLMVILASGLMAVIGGLSNVIALTIILSIFIVALTTFTTTGLKLKISGYLIAFASLIITPKTYEITQKYGFENTPIIMGVLGSILAALAIDINRKSKKTETKNAMRRHALLMDLDRSISNGSVSIVYQLKYDADTHKPKGVESLVRWNHPVRGKVNPKDFIEVAESEGGIEKLTLYILERAVAEISKVRVQTYQNISLSVNISTKLIGAGRLLEPIVNVLSKYQFPAKDLILEITETALIENLSSAQKDMEALKRLGVLLSIDDYGTGHASLSYLDDIPADEIKIDQKFIRNIGSKLSNQKIVRSTIDLAHSLGIKVVAEGVETKQIADLLRSMKCDQVQGYYLSEPVDLEGLKEIITKN